MKKLSIMLVVVLVMITQVCCVAAPAPKSAVGIIPPMALYVPEGGKIVTEINMSDNDVLGVVKLLLSQMSLEADSKSSFGDAVTNVKGVRVVVAQLPKGAHAAKAMTEAEAWAGKIGRFTKVFSKAESVIGQVVILAQENNAGYVGFAYNADSNTMYSARIVGSVDVAKILDIAGGFAPVAQAIDSMKDPKPANSAAPVAPAATPASNENAQ